MAPFILDDPLRNVKRFWGFATGGERRIPEKRYDKTYRWKMAGRGDVPRSPLRARNHMGTNLGNGTLGIVGAAASLPAAGGGRREGAASAAVGGEQARFVGRSYRRAPQTDINRPGETGRYGIAPYDHRNYSFQCRGGY